MSYVHKCLNSSQFDINNGNWYFIGANTDTNTTPTITLKCDGYSMGTYETIIFKSEDDANGFCKENELLLLESYAMLKSISSNGMCSIMQVKDFFCPKHYIRLSDSGGIFYNFGWYQISDNYNKYADQIIADQILLKYKNDIIQILYDRIIDVSKVQTHKILS